MSLTPDGKNRLISDILSSPKHRLKDPSDVQKLLARWREDIKETLRLATPVYAADAKAGLVLKQERITEFVTKELLNRFHKYSHEELIFLLVTLHCRSVLDDLANLG